MVQGKLSHRRYECKYTVLKMLKSDLDSCVIFFKMRKNRFDDLFKIIKRPKYDNEPTAASLAYGLDKKLEEMWDLSDRF